MRGLVLIDYSVPSTFEKLRIDTTKISSSPSAKIRFFIETYKIFPQLFPRFSPIFPNPTENGNGKSGNIWKTRLLLITFAKEKILAPKKKPRQRMGKQGKDGFYFTLH